METSVTPRFSDIKATLSAFGTKVGSISDGRLRLIVFVVSALLVGTGLYVHQSFAWFPVLMILNLVFGAPRMKDSFAKANKWLALFSLVALMSSLLIFTWVPQMIAMLIFGLGTLPMMLEFQAQAMKKAGIQPPKIAKKVAVKKKDPAKPQTNTFKKRLAKKKRGKKK